MKDTDIIGKDKLYHASICCAIAVGDTEAAIAAALAKEYGDSKAKGNHWCWWDCAADMVGIVIGTTIRLVLTGGRWHWY